MNSRQMIAKLDGYGGIIPFNSEELDVTLRALRLLAAAEDNDGTTPRTDALLANYAAKEYEGLVGADFARQLERERNGLAARVRELENECSAADIYGRTSARHGFINAPKWHELADETKSLYRESAAQSAMYPTPSTPRGRNERYAKG